MKLYLKCHVQDNLFFNSNVKMKSNAIIQWVKKWFTLIEVLIATLILWLFAYTSISMITAYNSNIVDQEKMVYAQRIASNYMEAIENIRTSTWVDSIVNPTNDISWVNFDRCWWDIKSLVKTDSVTSDLMWWFCKEIPGWTWMQFSELEWTYTVNFVRDARTWEPRYELSKQYWEWNPWNIETFDSYSAFFTVNSSWRLQWKFNELVNYSNNEMMTERFEWKKLDLNKYSTYFNNNKNIPWRAFLVTVKFENFNDTDKEVLKFKEEEREYFRKQMKKVSVKIEFWDAKQKRKTYVIERVFTNFKSSN